MKRILTFTLFTLFFLLSNSNAFAIYNPKTVPNNKYGIHIFSEKDIQNAKTLVNSNGGDWGYVTLVITETERDRDRWQKVFDELRRAHLIPIVRIATRPEGSNWAKPQTEEINNWIAFLNSLNWVVKNRYVIIYNEPNHSKEWGGEINPGDYAKFLKEFAEKLKGKNDDYFILPAGLDASASNSKDTMEEARFISRMEAEVPDVFQNIDGWNSHSYPNPGFSGKETDKGKGSIFTYDWELTYLATLGYTKDLPVFITETGWDRNFVDEDEISKRLTYAFQHVWDDDRVVAVTPFLINYISTPFEGFSWQKPDGGFYKYYAEIKALPKFAGQPIQKESGEIVAAIAQPVAFSGSEFLGAIFARNTGQSIWSTDNTFLKGESGNYLIRNNSFNSVEPTHLGIFIFKAVSVQNTGVSEEKLYLASTKGEKITNEKSVTVFVTKIDLKKKFASIRSSLSKFVKVF